MKKLFSAIIVFLLIFGFISQAQASDNPQLHKLRRGFINIVSSPLEIPKQTKAVLEEGKEKGKKNNPIWALSGVVKGVAYMGGRIGTGLWDVVTFNIPVPKDYAPVMEPEFICEKFAGSKAE